MVLPNLESNPQPSLRTNQVGMENSFRCKGLRSTLPRNMKYKDCDQKWLDTFKAMSSMSFSDRIINCIKSDSYTLRSTNFVKAGSDFSAITYLSTTIHSNLRIGHPNFAPLRTRIISTESSRYQLTTNLISS